MNPPGPAVAWPEYCGTLVFTLRCPCELWWVKPLCDVDCEAGVENCCGDGKLELVLSCGVLYEDDWDWPLAGCRYGFLYTFCAA